MSDVQLFLDGKSSLDEIAASVRAVTGLDLRSGKDAPSDYFTENCFYVDTKDCLVSLFQHGLVNDTFQFENYRFELKFRAPSDADVEFAKGVFAKLKASGLYGLLLLVDLEERLGEFHPARQAA